MCCNVCANAVIRCPKAISTDCDIGRACLSPNRRQAQFTDSMHRLQKVWLKQQTPIVLHGYLLLWFLSRNHCN